MKFQIFLLLIILAPLFVYLLWLLHRSDAISKKLPIQLQTVNDNRFNIPQVEAQLASGASEIDLSLMNNSASPVELDFSTDVFFWLPSAGGQKQTIVLISPVSRLTLYPGTGWFGKGQVSGATSGITQGDEIRFSVYDRGSYACSTTTVM